MRGLRFAGVVIAAAVAAVLLAPSAAGQAVVAHGGGADWDTPSHKEMVAWMVREAQAGLAREGAEAGPPHAVILGAVAREPNEPDAAADAFRAGGATAEALVITEVNADDAAIAAVIEKARIVWIRGGDQSRYVNWWKGRATERAIKGVFERGGVVGGTSAGCAVLGEVTYDAKKGSLRPEEALSDAHHEHLTLTDGFLNLVPGVLFDTHFTERGRIGRLPVMMARAKGDFGKGVLGVGVDHGTALLVGADGRAEVVGSGTVTFLSLGGGTAAGVAPGVAPRVEGLSYDRLAAGGGYHVRQRRVLTMPGDTPHIRVAGPAESRHIVSDAWARDGKIEERLLAAHSFVLSTARSDAVLLGAGVGAATGADGITWARQTDGPTDEGDRGARPLSVLCLVSCREPAGHTAGNAGDRTIHPQTSAVSLRGAVLHVVPPGSGLTGTGSPVAAPADGAR